ncbi:MAG: hypothetical protein JWO70_3430, partial [Betaproteobacteria bacterium]|nr:hypothetical protein [Betaproteobacteria bacterium]
MNGPDAATILIVDDERQNCKLLEALLRPEGYLTLSAASGEEALAAVAQHAPQLILLDVMMPGMDGYDVARILKADPVTSSIPIIMVTALTDRGARLAGLDAGAEEFLTKPVERAELWLRVRNLLRLKAYGDFLRNHTVTLEREVQARTESLRASESRFRQMADNIRDVFFLVDAKTSRMLYVSPAYEEIWGRSRASLYASAESWFEAFHPDDRVPTYEKYRHGLSAGTFEFDYRIVRPDGLTHSMEMRGFPVRDDAGKIVRIACVIKDITKRKAADERIRRLNRVYAVLSGINTLIVRVRDRDELFREACRISVEQGNFGMAWIGKIDPATMDLVPVACAGMGAEYLASIKSTARVDRPDLRGLVGRAIRELRPLFSNDISAEPGVGGVRRAAAIAQGYLSLVVLPLIVKGVAVGSLSLFAREANFFDEEELRLLTELAGDISFALDNIGRQQQLEKLERMRAVSSEINVAIVRTHDREALLRDTCRVAVERGKFEFVWVGLIDQEKEHIKPVAWAGFSPEIAHSVNWTRLSMPGMLLGEVIRSRKVVVCNDLNQQVSPGYLRQEATKNGCCSTVCMPLIADGGVIGIIILFAAVRGFFDDEEVALLNEVAGNISFALESIEKVERIARLNRIQLIMGSIRSLIMRVRDREDLFREACRIAVEYGGFGIAWIGVLDPETLDVTPVAHAGFQANESLARLKSSARLEHPRGQGVVGQAIRARAPVFLEDMTKSPGGGERREEAARRGYHSRIALPLLMDGSVVAVMVLYAVERKFFNDEELKLLSEMAGDISFAVENLAREQKIDKLSRIRTVSREINAAIVRIREREVLLTETCRIISEHGQFQMIWIGAIEQERQTTRPIAWKGFSEETAHSVTWSSISAANGTLAEAIRTGKASANNNVEDEVTTGRLRQEARRHGYRSSLSLPLVVDGRATVLIVLFATGRGFFDKDELALLEGVASDISFALMAIERREKLDYLAYYDVLTGLANRTLLLERVTSYMRSAASGGNKLALFLIDLERFKNINDSLGQPAGDTLLKQVAEWLTVNAGDANLTARVGADHFAVVLPEVRQEGS